MSKRPLNLRFTALFRGVWSIALISVALWPARMTAQTDQNGSLSGVIVDDRGTAIKGATLMLDRIAGVRLTSIFSPKTVVSDSKGLFSFSQLPSGLYRVCPKVPGSDLLDPCEWFPNPPSANLQAGQAISRLWVEMKHGKLLNVRIDDAGKNLKADAQGRANHFAVVKAISPGQTHQMPKVAEDAGGQNHTIAVPIGVALKLDVSSPTLDIKGQGEAGDVNVNEGKPAAAAAGTGGPAVPQSFQVQKGDFAKEYRFVAKTKGS